MLENKRYSVRPFCAPIHILEMAGTVMLVNDNVGGVYAYGFYESEADEITRMLNGAEVESGQEEKIHYTLDFDPESHNEVFINAVVHGELDVLLSNGLPVGLLIRNNEASLNLLRVMNGDKQPLVGE